MLNANTLGENVWKIHIEEAGLILSGDIGLFPNIRALDQEYIHRHMHQSMKERLKKRSII